MKLYLSSVGIPNAQAFRGLFNPSQTHQIALITNGWDNAPTKKSAPFIEAVRTEITGEGFACDYVDLSLYRHRPDELEAGLLKYAGVWVTGGNSFYLNWLMRESGFDIIIKRLLKEDFVYGSESAGTVVAGSTLHGVEVLDSITEAPHAIWNGMGLVPYGIIPHWGEEKYSLYLERVHREMANFAEVKTLANNDYIVVNED